MNWNMLEFCVKSLKNVIAMERAVLNILDYIILAATLIISASIGVFFRFYGSKQQTTDEYLLAGKDMAILPVAFSLMASFLSAIAMLGLPSEMYRFGTHMAFKNVGFIIGTVISSYIYLPVFFEVQAPTAYEYLERRFGKVARKISSFVFMLHMILYIPVVLYGPALALSAVTDLSTWVSVVSVGTVCTFYCTLGGMKAVLWTDAFQALLMFVGIFAVIIKGVSDVGGIEAVFQIAKKGGRLVVPGFEFGLDVRYTIWNFLLNAIIDSMATFGVNQVQVQRLLTVRNVPRARAALFLSIPLWVAFNLLNCLIGIIVYAYFANCDPITAPNASITSSDQLLPLFMISALSTYPGLAGLCICGLFSASLSTTSSAVNSLTAVTMEDIIRPALGRKKISEHKIAFISKIITFFYGAVSLALSFLVSKFDNLIQAGFLIFGLTGGPLLSMFTLGMMTQRTNEKGIVLGVITSIIFTSWISWGILSYAPPPKTLPISIEGCVDNEWTNATLSPYEMSTLFDAVEDSATNSPFFINDTVQLELEVVNPVSNGTRVKKRMQEINAVEEVENVNPINNGTQDIKELQEINSKF
ncbi:putative sodium-dependent multivitamin transporter [Uloborus diversus]|uniref:putative sodium-dependent multivitamin transporter n=1 Tax=Uloborus diversus TaxID=327109 RepID=UPI002409BB92|nr:putative sodium-dependent multivitamin transporter [Uloborus diversus]